MKKSNKTLMIIAGALVVIGIVIYGSMSLYSKLNQVDELNGRLDEAADSNAGQDPLKATEQPDEQPTNQTEQTPQPDATPIPELVPTTQPEEVNQPSPTATLPPTDASNNIDKGQKPDKESTNSEEKSRKKKEIDASVTAKLGKLKSSCQATSNSLVKQIAQELSGDEEATLATIQSKYLNKVFSAEADCDAKFNQLISNAKSEYKAADLGDQSFPDWSAQYESAKAGARANALTVIANSLNK
jgi:outer membrane biosynthesis protein TonB